MNERLSQLLDGELGEFERHRALRELDGNGELRGTWERYYLIRAALRKELSSAGHCRIADRVAARLHGESAGGSAFAAVGTAVGIRQAARWIGGLAIAASVATVAVLNWGPVAPTASAPSQAASVAPAPPVKPVAVASNDGTAATTTAGTTDRAAPDEQRARTDLGPYLVQHSEAAASAGAWRPYVRVVSYPSDQ
jgi:negative regulator of sigma E activity